MNGLSLFKFSRYFFALFLGITVIPLLSLLLWSNYVLEQNLITRQKQFLEMDTRRIHQVFQQTLSIERNAIEETAHSVAHKSLSLAEYKGIFNAQDAWWLDSPAAEAFFHLHPEAKKWAPKTGAKPNFYRITGDYFPSSQSIQSYFIVPLNSQHRGLLILKSTPAETFAPNGPYRVAIYAGNQTNPSSLIFQSDFMWHRPGFSHGFMPPPPLLVRQYPPNASVSLSSADNPATSAVHGEHQPGLGLAPPPPGWRDPNFNPKRSKVMVARTLRLTSMTGQIIATLDIKALKPPHPSSSAANRTNQGIGLLILVAGFLTSLLAGNYIRKNFVEPLSQLAQVATKVQEGDLNSQVDTETIKQADVRQTMEKVNAMLSNLADKEQLRNSFISNLTHDFRTPLVAQQRSLELLSQEMQQLGLKDQETLALGILKNSEHLLTMVNQLLETYQTEAGSFKLKLNQASIPTLVTQCFAQLAPLAEERHITLAQQFPENFPELMVAAYYLKRVFINLLGNAIENIPKRSKIEVSGYSPKPGWVQIHVKDNGMGIPEEEQKRLFERYYAGTGDTRKLGSGLGLYICAVLVAAHHGTISVDSVEGSHTDFIIDLPIFQ